MCILWHQTHRVNRVDFSLLWTFRCRVASRALWMCNIRQTEMKVVLYFVPVPVFIKTTYYWRQRRRRWRRLCCTSMYIFQASMSVWWRTFTFTLNIARHDIVPSIRNNNREKITWLAMNTWWTIPTLTTNSRDMCRFVCTKTNWLTLIWLLVYKWSC